MTAWALSRQLVQCILCGAGAVFIKEHPLGVYALIFDDARNGTLSCLRCMDQLKTKSPSIESSFAIAQGGIFRFPGEVCGRAINKLLVMAESLRPNDAFICPKTRAFLRPTAINNFSETSRSIPVGQKTLHYHCVSGVPKENPPHESFPEISLLNFQNTTFVLVTDMGSYARPRRLGYVHIVSQLIRLQQIMAPIIRKSGARVVGVEGARFIVTVPNWEKILRTVYQIILAIEQTNARQPNPNTKLDVKFGLAFGTLYHATDNRCDYVYGAPVEEARLFAFSMARVNEIALSDKTLETLYQAGCSVEAARRHLALGDHERDCLAINLAKNSEKLCTFVSVTAPEFPDDKPPSLMKLLQHSNVAASEETIQKVHVQQASVVWASVFYTSTNLFVNLAIVMLVRSLVRDISKLLEGRIIRLDGSRICVRFKSPTQAVAAVFLCQESISRYNKVPENDPRRIDVGWGLDQGDILVLPSCGPIGDVLKQAEDLCELSEPGQFYVARSCILNLRSANFVGFQVQQTDSEMYFGLSGRVKEAASQCALSQDLTPLTVPSQDSEVSSCTFADCLLHYASTNSDKATIEKQLRKRFEETFVVLYTSTKPSRRHSLIAQGRMFELKARLEYDSIGESGGTVMDTHQGNMFAVFDDVDSAFRAALKCQAEVANYNQQQEDPDAMITHRLGLHCGDLLIDMTGHDFFGSAPDLAVWLSAQSIYSGDILCSREVYRQLDSALQRGAQIQEGGYLGDSIVHYSFSLHSSAK
eukprot:c16050_g1_i1.p1 GENE.c16050_g1_i1~~c16050_g1_i1.p1  ORF type:complete len:814 (+),score=151.06 c16050_g1_i1:171-2444(+)